MATYKYNHAVKVNGKIYQPNEEIEVPEKTPDEKKTPKPKKKAESK